MFQPRPYQVAIAEKAKRQNLLVVLPTGLGKTAISLLVAQHLLGTKPEKAILVLAPTRPLAAQHQAYFKDHMEEDGILLTGAIKPGIRKELYGNKRLIFATPQTVQKDIEAGRVSLDGFSMIVFDEAHHAIGNYAYPFIAKEYLKVAPAGRILGLTASPGADLAKIAAIKVNLGIDGVEIRTESDFDIAPYVQKKTSEWIEVSLPDSFVQIKQLLEAAYRQRLARLKAAGVIRSVSTKKSELIKLQNRLVQRARTMPAAYGMLGLISQAIKIDHCLALLETQGVGILEAYWAKLRASTNRQDRLLLKDRTVSGAAWLSHKLAEQGVRHPKVAALCGLLARQGWKRAIIFANYRQTVADLVEVLSKIDGVRPVEFVGQKEGMSQKEQLARLRAFREGGHNVLVATSIGEEGLDIADADLAIFYDSVPSPLRTIQRRGRVGRTEQGRIFFLITAGTRDQAYYWAARRRERVMVGILRDMQAQKQNLANDLYTQTPKSL